MLHWVLVFLRLGIFVLVFTTNILIVCSWNFVDNFTQLPNFPFVLISLISSLSVYFLVYLEDLDFSYDIFYFLSNFFIYRLIYDVSFYSYLNIGIVIFNRLDFVLSFLPSFFRSHLTLCYSSSNWMNVDLRVFLSSLSLSVFFLTSLLPIFKRFILLLHLGI